MHDLPPRTPWPPDFPEVVIHAELGVRDAMPAYHAAKRGSAQAALIVAENLVSPAACERIKQIAARADGTLFLVGVTALEARGINLIPEMMVSHISRLTGVALDVENIVQTNRVAHTQAKSFQRIMTPASFAGNVRRGANYIIADDHVGLGGTLANLRGWIEVNGGTVIGATSLTASPGSEELAIGADTLLMLHRKYGDELTVSGGSYSDMSWTASPKEKAAHFIRRACEPLTPSQISWLRRRKRQARELAAVQHAAKQAAE